MEGLNIDDLREEFESVRPVTILSPTSAVCQYGR